MSCIKKINLENRYYLFKLESILKNNNISINKLMRDTNTDFKIIKRLMTGDLVKLDIIVLARLCNYLNCVLIDIVEYKNQSNNND